MGQWYDSRDNLRALIEWLSKHDWDEALIFAEDAMARVTELLEKPWKWQPEWEQFLSQNPTWKA